MNEEDTTNEEVPPSDSEEEEAVRAAQTEHYWEAASRMLSANRAFLLPQTRPIDQGQAYLSEASHRRGKSTRDDNLSPPRKRIRLSHSTENTPVQKMRTFEHLRSVQSSPIQLPSPDLTASMSPTPRALHPFPSLGHRGTLAIMSNNAEIVQILPTPSPASPINNLPGRHSTFPRSSVGALSQVETLVLPKDSCSDLTEVPSSDIDESELHGDLSTQPFDLFTPLQSQEAVLPSSLLRRHPLAIVLPKTSSPQILCLNFRALLRISHNTNTKWGVIDCANAELSSSNRTSMKTKKYERQLKGNPEAIVHMNLSRGRHRARSREPESGSDQEVDTSQFEPDESDEERSRKRRSTSATTHNVPHAPDMTSSPLQEAETEAWHPKAFDISFSDDDKYQRSAGRESEASSALPNAGDARPRRPKRFPMPKRSLPKRRSHTPSVRHGKLETSPVSRSFSRTISRRRIDSSDDEMPPVASPRTQISHSSPSNMEQDAWDNSVVEENPGVEDFPPTSSRASSSSLETYDRSYNLDRDVGDDEVIDQDAQLSPQTWQRIRTSARRWPHGEAAAEGASRYNPIEISDDDGRDYASSEEPSGDTESDSEPDLTKIPGGTIIGRMYPPGWIKQQLLGKPEAKPRQRHHSQDLDGGPVPPGHVRVRRRATPLTNAEIKGDPESSEEASTNEDRPHLDLLVPVSRNSPDFFDLEGHSSPDVLEGSPRRSAARRSTDLTGLKRSLYTYGHVMNAVRPASVDDDSSSDSESEDDEVYDAVDDRTRAKWNKEGVSLKGEGSLIDYMLNRTGLRKRKKKGTHRNSSRRDGPRLPRVSSSGTRIVTHGARTTGGMQTLLPFSMTADDDMHEVLHATSHTDVPDPPVLSHRRPGQVDQTDYPIDVSLIQSTSKQKDRVRANGAMGLYTFSGNGTRISTGRTHQQKRIRQEEVQWASGSSKRAPKTASHSRPERRRHSQPSPTPVSNTLTMNEYFPKVAALEQRYKSLTPTSSPPRIEPLAWPTGAEPFECKISKLQSGIALPWDSDLSRGRLQELLSSSVADYIPTPPLAAYFREASLDPSMPIASFVDILGTAILALAQILSRDDPKVSESDYKDWQRSFRNACLYVTWFRSQSSPDRLKVLHTLLMDVLTLTHDVVEGFHALRGDDSYVNLLVLDLQWFAIEMALRMYRDQPLNLSEQGSTSVATHIKLLVAHMMVFDSAELLAAISSSTDCSDVLRRVCELWISLVHITITYSREPHHNSSLWDVFHDVMKATADRCGGAWYITSEYMWTALFSLCAWAQFSPLGITTSRSRLPSSWKTVALALADVDLTDQEGKLPRKRQRKLDAYIRMLIGRCLVLHQTWGWELNDALVVVTRLVEVFKTRHFSGLSDEKADYPKFMRENDFGLLNEQKGTAYTLFLKLLVSAAQGADNAQIRKLISVTTPVGSVSFTKASSFRTYSSLFNRFTFITVATYLNPADAKNMVARARRFVDIKDMDDLVCRGYIRGATYIGIVLRKTNRPVQDVVDWLSDVADELVERCVARDSSKRVDGESSKEDDKDLVSIQLVLGGIAHIIKAEPWKSSWYPEPALLGGRCISRVCAQPKIMIWKVADEVQRLIKTYLNVRDKPLPTRLTLASQLEGQESQESQEDYGFSIDLDDAVLAAADDNNEAQQRQKRDKEVIEDISTYLMPQFDTYIWKGLREVDPQELSRSITLFGWVECWAACASVLDWNFYVRHAHIMVQETVSKLRLKLWLRFFCTAVQYDPSTYDTYKVDFLRLLIQCLAAPELDQAREFVALVLWNDGLRHPILHGVPCEPAKGRERFELSQDAFKVGKVSILDCMIGNICTSFRKQVDGDQSISSENEVYASLLCSMLDTVTDFAPVISSIKTSKLVVYLPQQDFDLLEHSGYLDFCRHLSETLSGVPAIERYPKLHTLCTRFHDKLLRRAI
ncbi:hypothetical protein NM688_g1310 [Phlebia brevispora]|uniref:Uncharacterized protein n=1 Tax=Phlebia brevispora TaxID=194682 RepID=A0ACC1TC33_9APHY|nr:hypothetical protein NM688_g1310 [Phlebia brevispora]